ncbi:MAG: hypothetical protein HZA35_02035 [Parcubacteria group bacterium]|nr:hypothetical protein [Parcubacteria group bacterium]
MLADSVKSVATLDNPYASAIMDRRVSIDEDFVQAIIGQSVFSWEGRNPASALDEDGNFQGTDLDLLSFLVPMAARGAVIEIPHYESRRQTIRKENERKIGRNQFGPITGLISNKDVLSFSVRLFDHTIVVTDPITGSQKMGAYRNYMIVDVDGVWYGGWDRIVFDPTAKENAFLSDKNLWTGNTVSFRYYVHPNRWQSIYGAPYLLLKMLVTRLDDEAKFYRAEMKRLEVLGISLPEGEKTTYVPPSYKGETVSIKVPTIEVEIDTTSFQGNYVSVADTQEGLVAAYNRQKLLTYTLKPRVQFVVRADEAAFMKHGEGRVAPWMGSRTWKKGHRLPKGKIDWNLMVLSSDCGIRFREHEKSEQVSAE